MIFVEVLLPVPIGGTFTCVCLRPWLIPSESVVGQLFRSEERSFTLVLLPLRHRWLLRGMR